MSVDELLAEAARYGSRLNYLSEEAPGGGWAASLRDRGIGHHSGYGVGPTAFAALDIAVAHLRPKPPRALVLPRAAAPKLTPDVDDLL